MKARIARWWRRTRRGPVRADALVLMYHRIAQAAHDPWALCVAPDHFADHVALLTQRCRVISFARLLAELADGTPLRRTVVITADDGYADNLLAGAPVLARADAPATVFVTTGGIGARRELWWDELERLVLSPATLPATCRVVVRGTVHEWELGDDATFPDAAQRRFHLWRADDPPPTARHRIYRELWSMLYRLTNDEKLKTLDALREWSGEPATGRPAYRTMTAEELVRLRTEAPVELGAHGVTHTPLDTVDRAAQYTEITGSRRRLEEVTGVAATAFAYPHGANDATTLALVRDEGFAGACTTAVGGITPDVSPVAIPRLHVRDWSADDLEQHLHWWFGS